MDKDFINPVNQLQATLKKMEVALGAIADAVVFVGEDNRVQWCNPACDRLLNQPHSSTIGCLISELLPLSQNAQPLAPDSYPQVQIRNDRYTVGEYEFQQAEQTLRLEISGSCVVDPELEKTSVLVLRNLTKIQTENKQSLSLLRTTFESIQDGILAIDRAGSIVSYNQKFLEMWSVTPEILAEPDHPKRIAYLADQLKDPLQFTQRVKELYTNPESNSYDLLELRDGRILERYSCPQRLGNEIIGRVWNFRDITERQQVETALKQSEERFRHMVENLNDMIYIHDDEGLFTYVSTSFLGYAPKELEGQSFVPLIHPDDLPQCLEAMQRAIAFGERQSNLEIRARDKQGIWHCLSCSTSTIKQPHGKTLILGVARDISERKRIEEALQASEAQYRDLVETANSIILRWDTQGNIRFINDYGQWLFGFQTHELIGRNVVGTIVPETETSGRDLQNLMQDICIHPEKYLFNENENLCKNKQRVWVAWANKPILDEQGNLLEILSVGTDATERKQVQAELENSLSLLQATFDSIQDGVLAINRTRNIVSYNQKFLEIWSLQPEDIAGISCSEQRNLLAERVKESDLFLTRIDEIFQNPEADSYDVIELKNNRILERYSCPQRLGDKIIGRVLSFRDVTEQQAALVERQKAEIALKESEEKFRRMVENANDIIYVANSEGIFSYLSPNLTLLLGYEVAEFEGKSFAPMVHPEDLPMCFDNIHSSIELGEPQSGLEIRLKHKQGNWRWFSFNTSVIRQSNGSTSLLGIARDITDRKETEAALQYSERKYRNIFQNSQVGIGRVHLEDGLFWDANQRCAELLGYNSPSELIEKRTTAELYVNSSHRQQMLAELQQQGSINNHEIQLKRKDGSIGWMLGSLLLNAEEECIDFVVIDISDRKEREQALRLIMEGTAATTGDEFFASCVRYLAQVLQVRYALVGKCIDETHICTLAVQTGETIGENFEYEVEGTPCENTLKGTMCYYPNNIQKLFPEDRELIDMGAHSYLGVPLKNSSGKVLGVLAVIDVKPMEYNPGRELILKIFAARTAGELERKQTEEALQRRVLVDRLLSNISRQFIDRDVDTATQFTLEAIAQLIGAERSCISEYSKDFTEYATAQTWVQAGTIPFPNNASRGTIEQLPWFHRKIQNGCAVQIANLAELPPEATLERSVFEYLSIQSIVAVPTIHSDNVLGFLAVDVVSRAKTWSQEDINLLKLVGELMAIGRARFRAEEALIEAAEAAEAANRAKSVFLANMSHELRTPLNAILGFAQLMERDTALTLRQRNSLATINRSGEHLLNLINDVLEMSKIEAGRVVLTPGSFDLHRLLQTIEEMFQIRAKAKQLSLEFEIAPNLPQYVVTDEGKLRQVLINLLGNAVKFTQTGGVTLRVREEIEAKNPPSSKGDRSFTINFEVEDTGFGIAPTEIKRLFQPFVQTASGSQNTEGTGLGLTISRQFVQLMGGDIDVRSTVGEGSIFCFSVQMTLAEASQVPPPLTSQRVLKLAPNQPNYRILVVDDRPENCDLIAQLMGGVGFEIQMALNGEEAIAQWQSWHPDLIWMDMRMPVMNGYEATRQIRAEEKARGVNAYTLKKTVIIALTASAFEEQQANILAAGCDDFVRKPFREQLLFEKMAQYLGVKYIHEQNNEQQLACIKEGKVDSSFVLNTTSLQVMPVEWISQLHQAALEVDGDLILQLIQEIPEPHACVAEGLERLVDRFCFDEILDLTQEG